MKIKGVLLLWLGMVLLSGREARAQDNVFFHLRSSKSKANLMFKRGNYLRSLSYYKQALKKDSADQTIFLRMGECCFKIHDSKQAEQCYRKAISNPTIITSKDRLAFAEVLLQNGKKEESRKYFLDLSTSEYKEIAENKIKGIDQSEVFWEDSQSYILSYLPINSEYSDISPRYYDGGIAYITAKEKKELIEIKNFASNAPFQDIVVCSSNSSNQLSSPKEFNSAINSKLHEGPFCFYNHQNNILFTRNIKGRPKSLFHKNSYQLALFSSTKKKDSSWTKPKALPFNSRNYSVGHPAISEDGEKLFFISDMPGGYGGTDIYFSELKNSSWTDPKNLGVAINTKGNESFPFLHRDSVLYFSSDGWEGLGGKDIYKVIIGKDSVYGRENIGFPINSPKDDLGIAMNENDRSGYFSSNRNVAGEDDIYHFDIIRITLHGIIKSRLKNQVLTNATITVLKNNKVIVSKPCEQNGSFELKLAPGKEYVLTINKENYQSYTTKISTKEFIKDTTLSLDALLSKNVKVLLRGLVLDSIHSIANLPIICKEKGSNEIDTIYSDSKGEFHTEIDPDFEYIFYTRTTSKFGKVIVNTNARKNGTYLLYTNIDLHPYKEKIYTVVLKDGDMPLKNTPLILTNDKTLEEDSFVTNEEGAFVFNKASYAEYILSVYFNGINLIEKIPANTKNKNYIELNLQKFYNKDN